MHNQQNRTCEVAPINGNKLNIVASSLQHHGIQIKVFPIETYILETMRFGAGIARKAPLFVAA